MRVCDIQIGERRGEANKRNAPRCSLMYSVDRTSSTSRTSITSTTSAPSTTSPSASASSSNLLVCNISQTAMGITYSESPRTTMGSGPILIKMRCLWICFRPIQSFDLHGSGSSLHRALHNYTSNLLVTYWSSTNTNTKLATDEVMRSSSR
jgi:hypothetical protein